MADPGLPRSATPPDGGTGSYVFSCQESDFTSKEYRDAIQIRIKNFETQLENKQVGLELSTGTVMCGSVRLSRTKNQSMDAGVVRIRGELVSPQSRGFPRQIDKTLKFQ